MRTAAPPNRNCDVSLASAIVYYTVYSVQNICYNIYRYLSEMFYCYVRSYITLKPGSPKIRGAKATQDLRKDSDASRKDEEAKPQELGSGRDGAIHMARGVSWDNTLQP